MFLKWWFHLGKTEMKRNLLVAAAITAILSGCGGGDEGGSTNDPAGTVDPVAPTLTPQIAPKLATPVLGETPNLRPQGEPVNGVRNQVELQKSKYASLL
ncbi:hypothetical protein I2712_001002, partial [Vibrio fluvialis]|nr:hypothetical protein [Vibrio fluvialis]